MSFNIPSHGLTDAAVFGHNHAEDGKPTGGYAVAGETTKDTQRLIEDTEHPTHFAIRWQDGPIDREAGEGANGALVEDVLEVCIRRLEFYQDSPFACVENSKAIEHLQAGLQSLLDRREDRQKRGVLGKHEV